MYEFCVSADGTVGRRLLLGSYAIVLAGERWVADRGEWWLDADVMNADRYAPIDAAAASDLIGEDTLDLPGADRRGAAGLAEAETERILAELPWARPGTWDYDHEMDKIAEVREAYARLTALAQERRALS